MKSRLLYTPSERHKTLGQTDISDMMSMGRGRKLWDKARTQYSKRQLHTWFASSRAVKMTVFRRLGFLHIVIAAGWSQQKPSQAFEWHIHRKVLCMAYVQVPIIDWQAFSLKGLFRHNKVQRLALLWLSSIVRSCKVLVCAYCYHIYLQRLLDKHYSENLDLVADLCPHDMHKSTFAFSRCGD